MRWRQSWPSAGRPGLRQYRGCSSAALSPFGASRFRHPPPSRRHRFGCRACSLSRSSSHATSAWRKPREARRPRRPWRHLHPVRLDRKRSSRFGRAHRLASGASPPPRWRRMRIRPHPLRLPPRLRCHLQLRSRSRSRSRRRLLPQPSLQLPPYRRLPPRSLTSQSRRTTLGTSLPPPQLTRDRPTTNRRGSEARVMRSRSRRSMSSQSPRRRPPRHCPGTIPYQMGLLRMSPPRMGRRSTGRQRTSRR